MKRLIAKLSGFIPATLVIALLALAPAGTADADAVSSLRGPLALESQKSPPPVYKLKLDQEKFARNYKTQPPLIPHKVAKYRINLKANRCIKCHGKANYKDEEAPMIGVSHFMDTDGKEGKKINMSRYFCTQCHVAQADAKPLVANTFKGTK